MQTTLLSLRRNNNRHTAASSSERIEPAAKGRQVLKAGERTALKLQ